MKTVVRRKPKIFWHLNLGPTSRRRREERPESSRAEILKSSNTERIGEGEGIGTKTPE